VTAIQAYKPEEEGTHVLRHSSLRPVTLLVRAPDDTLRRIFEASPREKVRVFGGYMGGAGTLTVSSVEVVAPVSGD
jgi:hypothetical protein